ncbi:unnamed protein product [Phytophthora fragariaefolia]|uniref:Unnamed protein product n=1 Tax=Phytophthora fragariaefolia TaxID=1490495 RepID=A0A9W6XQ03_9STRA|nr:unnamed protein product [Phytophthora fragariaefolia]
MIKIPKLNIPIKQIKIKSKIQPVTNQVRANRYNQLVYSIPPQEKGATSGRLRFGEDLVAGWLQTKSICTSSEYIAELSF